MTHSEINWQGYIEASPIEPHRTAKIAARLLAERATTVQCLDIGSGNGRDARFLAACGFDVVAVDSSPAAVVANQAGLSLVECDVVDYPLSLYDIINASLVLPFLPKTRFLELWPKLLTSLKVDGVIAGHFFGHRDWKVNGSHAWGCDESDVRQWLEPLQIEWFLSSEGADLNHLGIEVMKQTIAFVARKKA
ncbi:hypothetical protein GCM10009007_01020 [Formosimonas limnophila]|uniref:Methyltransferase domain-containing protein n=1 Tax=Formosimonas limnophila TaxID=1384487 RepID=A0A8J3CL10_9BURK|nr:methyltransferase domain-containing protein [Formosimonas limnophila]GHA64425.1 hypothetical protein GCM10009007_01020 [Formosimonas limnophila]